MNALLVREWLKSKGWQREQLAVTLGVSTGTINRILSGSYIPSRPVIIALASTMGCKETDLLTAKSKRAS